MNDTEIDKINIEFAKHEQISIEDIVYYGRHSFGYIAVSREDDNTVRDMDKLVNGGPSGLYAIVNIPDELMDPVIKYVKEARAERHKQFLGKEKYKEVLK